MVKEYVEMLITSIMMVIGFWISSDILFEEKGKRDFFGICIAIIIAMIMSAFNLSKEATVLGYAKIITTFMLISLFYKNRYRIKMSDALIGSVIIYANIIVSDLLVGIVVTILNNILKVNIVPIIKYGIVINITIITLAIIILKVLKKKYLKLYRKVKDSERILVEILILVFTIIMIMSGIIPFKDFELGVETLIIPLLMLSFFVISLYIVYEKIEKQKEAERYVQLAEYSKINEQLLEDYRVSCHENTNHFIIIDNMVPKRNKQVHEYIASILNNRSMNKYYFINELKNIPITELKGFINYKLMEMINNKIYLQVNISKEITKSNLKKLSLKEKEGLYNIIGVLLDNAYEAAKESKEKEVVLQMYQEKRTTVLLIANTYKGKVDIEKISEYGYSSKGRNHGTGLYIVENIINKSERFEKETSLMDNYFIQIVKIK